MPDSPRLPAAAPPQHPNDRRAPWLRLLASAALLLGLTGPAAASPYDWHAYPNGPRTVAAEPSDTWLLLEAERPAVAALEAVLAKAAPGAVLAAVKDLHPHRTAIAVPHLGREPLRRLGEALVAAGVATRFWPGFARGEARGFFDDALVVAFDAAPGPAERAALKARGVDLVAPTPLRHTWRAQAADGDAIGAAFAAGALPGVRWAEPDLLREVVAHQTGLPAEPDQGDQWHLDSADGRGDIEAAAAWRVTTGRPEVVVGVFEVGGFDLAHPDLAAGIVGGFDWADGDEDASAECTPGGYLESRRDDRCPATAPYRESHGTAVAGLVAARSNGVDGVGVCPDCSLYLVRMSAREALRSINAAGAFQRAADEGVAIINNSWGPADNATFPLSFAEKEVFDEVTRSARGGRGVLLMFSAGNVFQPGTNNPYNTYRHSMVISASTRVDDIACYTSYGAVVDVAAPSQGCFRNEPGIATADVSGAAGYSAGGFTAAFGGTSAAAPIAAGVAGLVLSVDPDLTAQQVRLILQQSAEKITADTRNWQNLIGRDLATEFAYDARGFSLGFGYGKVNARAAVALAANPGHAVGAPCGSGCDRCLEDRCAPDCATDADCPGSARCLTTADGALACQIAPESATDIGAPCSDECPVCVGTYDTEPRVVRICSAFCEADADCPFGFDCRHVDPQQPRACVRGHQDCGTAFDAETCLAGVRVTDAAGDHLCSCRCIAGTPGACPTGMTCASVSCLQARDGLRCTAVDNPREANEAPRCVPDPAWRAPCALDAECRDGEHCLDGACQPDRLAGACAACARCDGPDDCGPDHTCTAFPDSTWRCTRPCETDAECAGDAICREVAGQDGRRCASPGDDRLAPCAADWRCTTPGRCQTDADCAEGACAEGFCPGFAPVPPLPDAGPDTSTDGGPGGDAGSDASVVVVTRPRDDGGCALSGPTDGAPPAPWSLLGLAALLGLAVPDRRRRARGQPRSGPPNPSPGAP